MFSDYELPTSVVIDGIEQEFNSDYRVILDIFKFYNSEDLMNEEKTMLALNIFYKDFKSITNFQVAMDEMTLFINSNRPNKQKKEEKPVIDWEKDFQLIIAPINRVRNTDVRAEKMHWWTFLSAFMEIGECTLATYVGIREQIKKGGIRSLDKQQKKIYKENREEIDIQKKTDKATQEVLDYILCSQKG